MHTQAGAPSAFTFPERPQDAIVQFTILVEAGEGDTLKLSATLMPGSQTWGQQVVEGIFRSARTVPVEGTYVLQTGPEDTIVTAPEGVDQNDRRALVFVLMDDLRMYQRHLIEALDSFPPDEVINQAAREVVAHISMGSIESSPLGAGPVINACTVPVEGVKCAQCGFGLGGLLNSIAELMADQHSAVIKLDVVERDERPVVMVGYLDHNNFFALVLNAELAVRLKTAIEAVAVEVMTQLAVKAESMRRMCEKILDRVGVTYGIDRTNITQRVDSMEAEARVEMAEEIEDEDSDDYDADEGINDLDRDVSHQAVDRVRSPGDGHAEADATT